MNLMPWKTNPAPPVWSAKKDPTSNPPRSWASTSTSGKSPSPLVLPAWVPRPVPRSTGPNSSMPSTTFSRPPTDHRVLPPFTAWAALSVPRWRQRRQRLPAVPMEDRGGPHTTSPRCPQGTPSIGPVMPEPGRRTGAIPRHPRENGKGPGCATDEWSATPSCRCCRPDPRRTRACLWRRRRPRWRTIRGALQGCWGHGPNIPCGPPCTTSGFSCCAWHMGSVWLPSREEEVSPPTVIC
mmetsp:Transcript_24227/g.55130  ORF Transcript_24227/g.55130 Transcript_24227/m.55130 type:complete len:238 (-) Transcript_24227:1122-1835(-)